MWRYLFTEARKAVIAFGGAAAGSAIAGYFQAVQDGSVSQTEWEQIVGGAIVFGVGAAYAVFRVANKPAAPAEPAALPE